MRADTSCNHSTALGQPSSSTSGKELCREVSQSEISTESWSEVPIRPGMSSTGWLLSRPITETTLHFRTDPCEWLESNARLIKKSGNGRVFSIASESDPFLPEDQSLSFHVKERSYRHPYERLVQRFGQSGLRRASRLAPLLRRSGVATPEALGFATISSRRVTREYLLTQSVPEGRSLHEFLGREYPRLSSSVRREFRILLAENLSDLVYRLHSSGCENRDLKATNLVLKTPETNLIEFGIVELFLIDLEGVRQLGITPRFRRERDMTRLNLSLLGREEFTNADRGRFLKSYLRLMESSGWKDVWKRLARSTTRRLSSAERVGKSIH